MTIPYALNVDSRTLQNVENVGDSRVAHPQNSAHIPTDYHVADPMDWESLYGKTYTSISDLTNNISSFVNSLVAMRKDNSFMPGQLAAKATEFSKEAGKYSADNAKLMKAVAVLNNSPYRKSEDRVKELLIHYDKNINLLEKADIFINNFASLKSPFNVMNNRYSKTEASFTGVDIKAVYSTRGEYIELGDLAMISVSTFREKSPVRTLGHVNPKGYTRGGRTIAGTMVFATFNQDAFTEAFHGYGREKREYESSTPLIDQLPPFEIILTFRNEHGASAVRRLYGVEIQSDGETYSVDDMMIERTINYIARDSDPLLSGIYGSEVDVKTIGSAESNAQMEQGLRNMKLFGDPDEYKSYKRYLDEIRKDVFLNSILGRADLSLTAADTIKLKERVSKISRGSFNDSNFDYSPTGVGQEEIALMKALMGFSESGKTGTALNSALDSNDSTTPINIDEDVDSLVREWNAEVDNYRKDMEELKDQLRRGEIEEEEFNRIAFERGMLWEMIPSTQKQADSNIESSDDLEPPPVDD
jgi:hypothetical protein